MPRGDERLAREVARITLVVGTRTRHTGSVQRGLGPRDGQVAATYHK